jgi:hypothetical protein
MMTWETATMLLVSLQCVLAIQHHHKNYGLFVAGFITSKQQSDALSSSSYQLCSSLVKPSVIATTNSRIHETRLWYGNNNEDDEDAGTIFFASGGGDSSGRKKKKKVIVSVDVNVMIARGIKKNMIDETSYYDIGEEMRQEFYQEEVVCDCSAYDDSPSTDDIMMSFPEVLEDFSDKSSYYGFATGDEQADQTEEDETQPSSPAVLIKAIEPTKDKPTKKFISPIQLIKHE